MYCGALHAWLRAVVIPIFKQPSPQQSYSGPAHHRFSTTACFFLCHVMKPSIVVLVDRIATANMPSIMLPRWSCCCIYTTTTPSMLLAPELSLVTAGQTDHSYATAVSAMAAPAQLLPDARRHRRASRPAPGDSCPRCRAVSPQCGGPTAGPAAGHLSGSIYNSTSATQSRKEHSVFHRPIRRSFFNSYLPLDSHLSTWLTHVPSFQQRERQGKHTQQ